MASLETDVRFAKSAVDFSKISAYVSKRTILKESGYILIKFGFPEMGMYLAYMKLLVLLIQKMPISGS